MQLLIAVIGFLTALVPFIASIVQLAHSPRPAGNTKGGQAAAKVRSQRRRAAWLLGTAVAIAGLTLLAAYVVVPRLRSDPPLAELSFPQTGDRIRRPQTIDIKVNRHVPEEGSLWLGYQNEEGGPFIVQAAPCSAIENRLDCGPLYVGHDPKDPAEFRIFLLTANAAATRDLSRQGESRPTKPGDNAPYDELPAGSTIITEVRRVTLRNADDRAG